MKFKTSKPLLSIVMYRNWGIKDGRNYQPDQLYQKLFPILDTFYLLRNYQGIFKGVNKIVFLPFFQIVRAWISIKRKKSRGIYEVFNEHILHNITLNSSHYMFCYIPDERILQKLKRANKKLILYFGGMSPGQFYTEEKKEFEKFIKKKKDITAGLTELRLMNTYFDYGITMSPQALQTWKDNGFAKPLDFVPLGVNTAEYNLVVDEKQRMKDKIFLFVGRVTVTKGLHYLLQAWRELNWQDAKLIIVGTKRDDEWEYFEPLLNHPTIFYYGYRTDMPCIYNRSLALVFPTLSEGFGKVATEAMASSVPVIGTYCVEHAFENRKSGIKIDVKSVQSIKEALTVFYKNPQKAIVMGKNARKRVENQTWELFGTRFEDVITRIINSE